MSQPSAAVPHTAMILAAGRGTRMRPLSDDRPKPLVPVLGTPILDWTIARLAAAGVRRVVVNAHVFPEQLERHAARWTVPEVIVRREREVLETGGGVVNALDLLGGDPFFVVNGDIVWLDGPVPALTRLAEADRGADAVVLAVPRGEARGYDGPGDLHLDAEGRVHWREPDTTAPLVFGGVSRLHPRLLRGREPGYGKLAEILRDGADVRGVAHDAPFFHIGTPAHRDAAARELDALGVAGPDGPA